MAEVKPARLCEPLVIEDVYVDGLAGIEAAGDGNMRLTFCVSQSSGWRPDMVERVVRARLVMGPTLLSATICRACAHFGVDCCGALPGIDQRH